MLWWQNAGQKALERTRELMEEIVNLRRDFKSLELEWNNVYDKLKQQAQRVAKRAEVIEKSEEPNSEEGLVQLAQPGNGTVGTGPLTPRQKQIQQQVLRRRAGREIA